MFLCLRIIHNIRSKEYPLYWSLSLLTVPGIIAFADSRPIRRRDKEPKGTILRKHRGCDYLSNLVKRGRSAHATKVEAHEKLGSLCYNSTVNRPILGSIESDFVFFQKVFPIAMI